MKVLVIPEDQELDQYIVKPIVEAIFADLDRRAQVVVLPEPRLRGAADALDAELLREIVTSRPMFDLFLLVVDRDCNRMNNVEKAAAREGAHAGRLIACLAEQEIEVWLLALHAHQVKAPFKQVRAHCDPKEMYAEPLLETLGSTGPGKGRKHAMRALTGKLKSLCAKCPELGVLRERIAGWLEGQKTI